MQMKNCVPPLSGRPGTITADTAPRVCFSVEALLRQQVEAAGAGAGPGRRIPGQRIAALHDALAHDAVEGRAGEAALLRPS